MCLKLGGIFSGKIYAVALNQPFLIQVKRVSLYSPQHLGKHVVRFNFWIVEISLSLSLTHKPCRVAWDHNRGHRSDLEQLRWCEYHHNLEQWH